MLKEGQTLWFVPAYVRSDGYEVIVVKVGRTWAHLSNGKRVNINTLSVACSAGECYASQGAYRDRIELETAWRAFLAEIRNQWSPIGGVTIDDINQAMALLKIQKKGGA